MSSPSTQSEPVRAPARRFDVARAEHLVVTGLAALVLLGFALIRLAPELGHRSIASWDESAHQAVTRGLHDTGQPLIYPDPLVPAADSDWLQAHVFLHKPTLPFALGAAWMWLTGITPAALRGVSLIFAWLAAVALFLLGRKPLGYPLALAMALGFLSLPFGFNLIQGYQFGDVTDCSLLGALALTFVGLTRAIERDSNRLALLAGAAFGVAFLCKTALAIVPLGVVGALLALGKLGAIRGPRPGLIGRFLLAALVVALPLNVYQARTWPQLYWFEAGFTLSFLGGRADAFTLPVDTIFNQVNEWEFTFWPVALLLLAGLWLAWAALVRRDVALWILSLWLWGEWIPLSFASVKAPAHTWGVAPAVFIALGLLLRDSVSRPVLAGAALGGFSTPWVLQWWPQLSRLRELVPAVLVQSRARPGLVEGLALIALGAGFGFLLRQLPGHRPLHRTPGVIVMVLGLWTALVGGGRALSARQTELRDQRVEAYTDTLGRAIDASLGPKALLLWGLHRDTPCCFEDKSLQFYSGRMVYKQPLADLARQRGYHPYLISSRDQPFERVAAVPGRAWLQAYDLDRPLEGPADPPPDVPALEIPGRTLTLLGAASDRGSSDRDRYVFYVRGPPGAAATLRFETADGQVERRAIDPTRTLTTPDQLVGARWYTLTSPGPLRAKLKSLSFDDQPVPLP